MLGGGGGVSHPPQLGQSLKISFVVVVYCTKLGDSSSFLLVLF